MEIRQRKGEIIVYDSWAATSETVSLFGCAGQQSDNGWRSLVEPAVPLGFLNAVRGGWRGSSAIISTFRDTHSCRSVELAYLSPLLSPLSCFLFLTSSYSKSLFLILLLFFSFALLPVFIPAWQSPKSIAAVVCVLPCALLCCVITVKV